jgi:hypothetical protein
MGAIGMKASFMAEQPAATAPLGDPAGRGQLPTVLKHLVAVAQARMGDRGTVHTQPAGTGRYVITACRGDRDLVMMFARRRRNWVLTAAGVITGGHPQAVSCRATARSRPRRTPSCRCEPTGRPGAVRLAAARWTIATARSGRRKRRCGGVGSPLEPVVGQPCHGCWVCFLVSLVVAGKQETLPRCLVCTFHFQ